MMKNFLKALSLGAAAGVKSVAAKSLLEQVIQHEVDTRLNKGSTGFFRRNPSRKRLKLATEKELVLTAAPSIPREISLGDLAERGFSGAVVGAAIYASNKGNSTSGAVVGCVAAVVATCTAYYLNRRLERKHKWLHNLMKNVGTSLAPDESARTLKSPLR